MTADSSPDPFAHPGMTLANVQIERRIDEGATAVVYKGRDRSNAPVALKVGTIGAASPRTRARFVNEARLARSVRHPNLVHAHDAGELDAPQAFAGRMYLTMAYVHGEPLARTLEHFPHGMPEARVRNIALQLAEGLAAMHAQGIVHRDVKPGNIMLDESDHATLIDFGIAYALGTPDVARTEDITVEGGIPGTTRYMSPEQLKHADVTLAFDTFAFGATLYELLSGAAPDAGRPEMEVAARRCNPQFKPYPLRRIAPEAAEDLVELAERCLAFDPAARPAMEQIVHDLVHRGRPEAWPEAEASRALSTSPRATLPYFPTGAFDRAWLQPEPGTPTRVDTLGHRAAAPSGGPSGPADSAATASHPGSDAPPSEVPTQIAPPEAQSASSSSSPSAPLRAPVRAQLDLQPDDRAPDPDDELPTTRLMPPSGARAVSGASKSQPTEPPPATPFETPALEDDEDPFFVTPATGLRARLGWAALGMVLLLALVWAWLPDAPATRARSLGLARSLPSLPSRSTLRPRPTEPPRQEAAPSQATTPHAATPHAPTPHAPTPNTQPPAPQTATPRTPRPRRPSARPSPSPSPLAESATPAQAAKPAAESIACARARTDADSARRARNWARVLALTQRTNCWPRADNALLRAQALYHQGRYKACVRAAAGVSTPELIELRKTCYLAIDPQSSRSTSAAKQ